MIRVHVLEGEASREGGVALAEHVGPRWVDIQGRSEEDVAWLGEKFAFHPLALEDCLHVDQRPKIEDYPTELFVVIHGFTAGSTISEVRLHELHVFLRKDLLVTVHDDPIPALEAVRTRLARDGNLLARGPDLLFHAIADGVTDAHLPLVDAVHEELEALELDVFERPAAGLLERIFELKRVLLTLRRTLAPVREIFVILARGDDPRVSKRGALYFRDVWDHVQRTTDSIDAAREMLGDVLNAYHSELANRTNSVMKRLTLFSALLLPLTFLTGFFGMNFQGIHYEDSRLLVAAMVAMVIVPLGTVVLFRLLRWL